MAEKTLLRNKKAYCNNCKTGEHVHDVRMPYAFKLLLQELMAMNIATRLSLKDTKDSIVIDNMQHIEGMDPINLVTNGGLIV